MLASARSALAASGSERSRAVLGVVLVHLVLAIALLSGLNVRIPPRSELVSRLIDLRLMPPPPEAPAPPPAHKRTRNSSAPKAASQAQPGSRAGPVNQAVPRIPDAPIVVRPQASGGGSAGTGESAGSGSGGGSGGTGQGDGDDGGTDLEQIAGEIRPSDYPRDALRQGIGGRVEFRFTVGPSGRVTNCAITRSSGSPELDSTTCRLVTERFRYRPSTDSRGRPIADEVDGEHVWRAGRP
jgi:protein TonB